MLNKMLRVRQVIERTGLPRSSLYLLIERGEFPRQVKLGPRTVAWVESEIDEWMSARIATRRVDAIAA